jgi:hypothetical protein
VDYVLIGDLAVQAYGPVWTTVDFRCDRRVRRDSRSPLAGALRDLGAGLRGVDGDWGGIHVTDPRQLHEGGTTDHDDLDAFADPGAPRS